MSFSAMAKWLAPAKLSFACSAHYPDQIDMINFTAEQSALLKEIASAGGAFREAKPKKPM